MTLAAWVEDLGDLVEEFRTTGGRINRLYVDWVDVIPNRQYAVWRLWAGVYYGLFGRVFTLLPMDSVSPTYSPLAPLGWLSDVQLSRKTMRMENYLRAAESQWGASPWYGALSLDSLVRSTSTGLRVVLSLTDDGYLIIEENESPGRAVLPRLLPAPLL